MKPESAKDEGNTEGRQLVIETQFAKVARTIPLTPLQRAMLIGSLLGDATLLPTTAGFCFRVHHGHRQKAYVDWKYAVLSRYVRTAPRECRNGYYFRTVTHPEFSRMREQFYQGTSKIVPMQLLIEQFTEHSLAVWLMDDGGADGNQIRLNTQSFTIIEVEGLQGFLRAKLGLNTSINMDKGKPRLRFTAASTSLLNDMVRSHIIPSMLYKFAPVTTSRQRAGNGRAAPTGANLSRS